MAVRLRVLVACEFSAVVASAFRALGHDAWSCDLEPTEGDPRFHLQGDVLDLFYAHQDPRNAWDLVVAHPPCTDLAASGARWWPAKRAAGTQQAAAKFVADLWELPVARLALENPVGWLNTNWRKSTQTVQPWQFGDPYMKTTHLWLRGLPNLVADNIVEGRQQWVAKLPDSKGRAKARSRTFPGMARAMAEQWGGTATVSKWGGLFAATSPSASAR